MSTLPGLASKGEKGKSKYQSLDINNLYRVSRGESIEKQQQKSSLPLKHGMQSLGRVPSARRPPANLPSIKSEHSGTDAAVSLVPSGGPGWGKQETTTSSVTSSPSTTSTVTNSSATSPAPVSTQISAHQAAIALPVTTTIPPPVIKHNTPSVAPATTDKSWSAVMSGSDLIHPPPYQSPQFQHEFPSLSAGDGGPPRAVIDTQYGPGPSLRPQTEGSWMQGGSRANSELPPRSNSAPLGAPPQLSAQVGLTHQSLPPQYHGILPQFMYRGNFATNGHGTPNVTNMPTPMSNNGRNRVENRQAPTRGVDNEELARRPIIKEEDLSRMDDMTKDMGWAAQEDIDYNQKLAFSDDECAPDRSARKTMRQTSQKEQDKAENVPPDADQSKNWGRSAASTITRARSTDEDEILAQKRRQQHQVLLTAAEKAKQRKEEEEKRYLESKQAAGKKLQDLLNKGKRDKDQDETQGTISPSVVPPQPITPTPIPIPDWEKERDRPRNESSDEKAPPVKSHRESASDFRQLTQIEGRNFVRKDSRNAERERDRDMRERNGPGFSRQMQNLPPRLQKKQQLRNNSSPQPPMSYPYDPRWMQNNQAVNKTSPTSSARKTRSEWEGNEKEREDEHMRYYSNDEGYRGPNRFNSESGRKSSADNRHEDEGRDFRNQNYDYKKEKHDDKWERNRDTFKEKQDIFDEHSISRQNSDEWHSDRHDKYNRDDKGQDRYERPQRPDSRDSRTSRESRHSRDSEPREHISTWAENMTYDEKRKDHSREDRRPVPGPITKEKIEADEKHNEKRNLTQLKRGSIPEKKPENAEEKATEKEYDGWNIPKKDGASNDNGVPRAWADDVAPSTVSAENAKFTDLLDKSNKSSEQPNKEEVKQEEPESKRADNIETNRRKEDDDKRIHNMNRNRSADSQPRSQGWDHSGGVVYRTWFKKSRGSRPGGSHRSSVKSGEWHGTDSDGSFDEMSVSTESGKDDRNVRSMQKSPKPARKSEKDEKNKDAKSDKLSGDRKNIDRYHDSNKREYEPRGEPSRHGRGGGNIRSRGGLSKRIDGYGPPPSKSPFGHSEDKDRKQSNEEASIEGISSDERSKSSSQANAGIIGSSRKDVSLNQLRTEKKCDDKFDRNKPRKNSDNRKTKPKSKDDNCDTSDHSDDSANKFSRKTNKSPQRNRILNMNSSRRNNPPPRLSGEKRGGNSSQMRVDLPNTRQNSGGPMRSVQIGFKKDGSKDEKQVDGSLLSAPAADAASKTKDNTEDAETVDGELEDKSSTHGDSDGFQEVKSKKTGKERQKSVEEKPVPKSLGKLEISSKPERKGKTPTSQLSQQQIANIPSLMDTPVNPPSVIPQPNKNQYDRPRQKLPPRLAKQRENSRLQKAQMQHGMCDVNDINKVNQNMNLYALKDGPPQVSLPMSNAWEKPLSTQLRGTIDQDPVLLVGIDKSLEQPQSPGQQNVSPGNDKVIGKGNQLQDKSVLDGATPPVNTIIFENTNYKLAPGVRGNRNEKPKGSKLEDGSAKLAEALIAGGYNKPMTDLLNKNDKQSDIQMQLAFNKEDNADMKLDFFDSEISHLTEDKSSKNLSLPRSMHVMTSSNSTISPSAADLNFKIASVKKVWESSMPPVIEHNVSQEDANSSFSSSFGPDPNSLDPTGAFAKGTDTPDDGHEGYSPSPNQNTSNSTTNVCKVKPTQQVPGTTGQTVVGTHQQHSGMISSGLMGPLSPPPIQPVIGPNVGLNQPPQQFATNQHIGYQTSLGGSTQYGMSAIPSPPTVLFNSTQQIQPQAGLYGGFQIDQLGGQRGSQYSQYPNPYNLGQTASSPYSAQSLYLQTAQPHPPPTAQAPPDLYQNLSNYRMAATGPFGQNQQLNNPTTVLISSTSNSLMSATVKPSSQQISAIGTKAGGVGQTYQQQSQQGQQLYMTYDPSMQTNYLTNTGVMPRGPTGPVQNNVVPALQPSSSYYSGSTGGQTGYFQTGNSTLQSGPLQQHQAGYGLQGNVFGTHNQSHTNPSLQNFGSHYLSQMQLAAMNVPQFRTQNLQNTSYMKGMGNQQIGDQSGRSQQLKSPGTQQEVLSSVFNSGPQIPSPKSRQNCKQPPPQPSPTTQHKYNLYQSVGNQPPSQLQRYPTPIQRPPSNFQPTLGSVQNNGAGNQKHRANNSANKGPTRQYYSPQGGGLTSQNEKSDDSKLGDSMTPNATNSNSANIVSKATIGNITTTAVNQTAEIGKDMTKDDSSAMKD